MPAGARHRGERRLPAPKRQPGNFRLRRIARAARRCGIFPGNMTMDGIGCRPLPSSSLRRPGIL